MVREGGRQTLTICAAISLLSVARSGAGIRLSNANLKNQDLLLRALAAEHVVMETRRHRGEPSWENQPRVQAARLGLRQADLALSSMQLR